MENNGKIELEKRLTTVEVNQKYLREDLTKTKDYVTNHIPTAIKELDKKLDNFRNANRNQFVGMLISIILLLVAVIIQK